MVPSLQRLRRMISYFRSGASSSARRVFVRLARARATLLFVCEPRPLLVASLVLAVAIVLVMGQLVLRGRFLLANDIWTSDLLSCNVPPRVFLGRELRAGRFPLWMPGSFGGLPLVPQGEGAVLNPFTWILFGLFDWITATNLSIVLHSGIAGIGMVLLARRFGAQLAPAVVAGLAFMLSGFLVEHVKHLNMHHAASWIPLLTWVADRVLHKPRFSASVLLGFVGALQVTEGHPQITYLALFVLVPVLGVRFLGTKPWRPSSLRRYMVQLLAAGIFSTLTLLALSGAYLAGAAELLSQSERWSGRVDRWDFATHYEFVRDNLLSLFWANPFGDAAYAQYNASHGFFWESWFYIGVVPCLGVLAAITLVLVHPWRRRTNFQYALFFLALGGLSIPLTMGKRSAIYRQAFDVVPGLALFRFHHRFGLVLTIAAIMLAAIGLTAFLTATRRWVGQRAASIVGVTTVVLTMTDLAYFMTRHFVGAPGGALAHPASVEKILARAPHEPFRVYGVFAGETHGEAFDAAKGGPVRGSRTSIRPPCSNPHPTSSGGWTPWPGMPPSSRTMWHG